MAASCSSATLRLTRPSSSPAAAHRPARSLQQLPRLHAARQRAPLRVSATAPAAKPATAAAPTKPTPPAKDRWHKPAAATAEAAEGSSPAAAVPAPNSNGATSSGDDDWPAQTGVLLIKCDDSKGVVASVAQLLFGFGCNILSSDQFSAVEENMFYQRVVFDYSDMLVGPGNTAVLERGIAEVARKYNMEWRVSYSTKQKRMALLVSKLDHCLYDLLIRVENGEMNCSIPIIISNHPGALGSAGMAGM
jgi:formyltetrahydrofolate deformylase